MQLSKELEYLHVLKALSEIPFGIGKNLLISFLQGDENNDSVRRHRLAKLETFSSLCLYEKQEIESLIDNLSFNNMIEQKPLPDRAYVKILSLTEKGRQELSQPAHHTKKLANSVREITLTITPQDKEIFKNFDFYLSRYNDEQKKAIICPSEKILCIAGAGSGKTTVLTKRIEFLTQFRSVPAEKILAITFTRKARAQMISKLLHNPVCSNVKIETFNSFSEKILEKYNDILYIKKMRVINFSEKMRLIALALSSINMSFQSAIDTYFSYGERNGKTGEELARIFTNDCFFVLDYCKNYNKKPEEIFRLKEIIGSHRQIADMTYKICIHIQKSMEEFGLRDYADQLVECIRLFKIRSETTPCFEHILVDEYQDINSAQAELIDILNPKNLFCVGDPRQSIFGWRGSRIGCILNFHQKYSGCEIIPLSTNYRSAKQIISIMNLAVSSMKLPPLQTSSSETGDIRIIEFEGEDAEMEFIIQSILHKKEEFGTTFILARTNRMILELSDRLKIAGIRHTVKTEEIRRYKEDETSRITLATVHSIKGLEADTVFVIGSTQSNFPCRASEHPVIEMIKIDDYDKEEEERRLFYVAISRAKKRLFLTYTKSLTKFVTEKMKSAMLHTRNNAELSSFNNPKSDDSLKQLREWRKILSEESGVPAYVIMHDKTMIELATIKPSCIEDLENIYGLGPTKIRKYGESLLKIVNGV